MDRFSTFVAPVFWENEWILFFEAFRKPFYSRHKWRHVRQTKVSRTLQLEEAILGRERGRANVVCGYFGKNLANSVRVQENRSKHHPISLPIKTGSIFLEDRPPKYQNRNNTYSTVRTSTRYLFHGGDTPPFPPLNLDFLQMTFRSLLLLLRKTDHASREFYADGPSNTQCFPGQE